VSAHIIFRPTDMNIGMNNKYPEVGSIQKLYSRNSTSKKIITQSKNNNLKM